MILSNNYKSVEIKITTYKRGLPLNCKAMNESDGKYKKNNQNRFICSICLNKKVSKEDIKPTECFERKSKSCPICQKQCDIDENNIAEKSRRDNIDNEYIKKKIQTSQPDVAKGLTLLNEVLTVFQSKKQLDCKRDNTRKTIVMKDASVETVNSKPKLTFSKTFLYSFGEDDDIAKNGIFSVINSQPETVIKPQFSLDLKHKSSSIPQMKLEELKYSLKEKTKSKDAIEEVNRMFATVRSKQVTENLDGTNRPMIRNGPRVLPVVKTNNCNSVYRSMRKDKQASCDCNAYHMSSGDSMHGCCCKQERCNDHCTTCHHCKQRYEDKICEHCCNTSRNCKHTIDISDG